MRRIQIVCVALAVWLAATMPARAQSVQTGNIHGRVVDQSSAMLPGVSISLESPALLLPQQRISDAAGEYRFDQLPVGVYRMTFELSGFQKLVRENVQITAAFSAEINGQLQIGALEESITVSGASPVIDTTSSTSSVSLPASVLADKLPVTRVMQGVLAVAPGVQSGAPDLGGGNVGTTTFVAYGMSGQSTPLIEGINTRRSANNVETNYDFTAIEDFQIVTFGGDADKALPGVGLNAVIKSGGNMFSGRHEVSIEDDKFEGNNLTDEIRAQGTTNPNLILTALDVTDNLGGPVMRNRWWFFGAYHLNRSRRTALGYLLPDGEPGNSYVRAQNYTGKSTLQLTPKYKAIGFWTRYTQLFPERFGSAFVPLENTRKFVEPATQYKVELQGSPTSHVFFNVFAGHHGYTADYYAKPDEGLPNAFDQATRLNRGPNLGQDRRPRMSEQITGSLSYVPAGSLWGKHELKVGSTWMYQWTGTRVPDGNHGNYMLVFNNGVPVQIQVFNYPITNNSNNLNEGGVYGQDTWRLGNRLTLSLGLRYDSFVSWVPEQTKEAGVFGPPWDTTVRPAVGTSLDIPRVDAGAWRNLAPRFGLVWDATGDGKTVVKASYGRYNMTPGDDYAAAYNPNTATITTFKWTGPCPAGPAACDYIPGTVNLDPNGTDFLSITGGSNGGAAKLPNTEVNTELAQQFTRQFQLMVEREVAPDLAIRGGVSYAQSVNLWQQNPIQIPYAAWNIPRTVYDAGPGVTPSLTNTTGTPITIYDLDPAYRGGAFSRTQYFNRTGDYNDHFLSYEATLTKRATGRWNAIAGVSTTKNYRWITTPGMAALPSNPNLLFFPLDETRAWQFRLTGSYDLPWSFDLSAQYLVQNGVPGQRSNTYNLPNSGSLVLPVEEFGGTTGGIRPSLNLRIARAFRLGRQSFRTSLELLNATNDSSPYAITTNSGPAFGRITTISTPRIARFGLSYSF